MFFFILLEFVALGIGSTFQWCQGSLRGNTDFTLPPFSDVKRGISAEVEGGMMLYSSMYKAPFSLWNVFHLQKIQFRERFINIRKGAN